MGATSKRKVPTIKSCYQARFVEGILPFEYHCIDSTFLPAARAIGPSADGQWARRAWERPRHEIARIATMMPELASIYDQEFFREWGKNNKTFVASARRITEILHRILRPRRIVDVGSGCGVYGHHFRELGVEVLSIDGVRPPPEESFPGEIVLRDLTVPFANIWGAFDFALCLEVAEHIPEELSEPFLANLAGLSDVVVLSAAPPKQGGHHHVNEQPKRYWVRKFAAHGFVYNRKRTGVLLETFKHEKPAYMWMCEQISIYERHADERHPARR